MKERKKAAQKHKIHRAKCEKDCAWEVIDKY